MSKKPETSNRASWQHYVVLSVFVCVAGILMWRVAVLQLDQGEFLRDQADSRHLRTLPIPAHRGMITDRNGEPLAMSAPMETVWADPSKLVEHPEDIATLARALGLDVAGLREKTRSMRDRRFMYVQRQVTPDQAGQVKSLGLAGVYLKRESRRFYPAGEVASQLVGFTDIDGVGQEGLELAFDDWLSGKPGAKLVIKDLHGGVVEDVEQVREAEPGKDLALSIDRRLQYLAYRELKKAVRENGAKSGSAVLLDVDTGEVLAMVNQPSFNPNNRADIRPGATRNRAMTDSFEPGSTMKPFTIAAALESGDYAPDTPVDTAPGWMTVGRYTIKDHRNYGTLDVTGVIRKSSNVGASRIALSMEPEQLWSVLSKVGLGSPTAVGFPGEAGGVLRHFSDWRKSEVASHSYGYGMSVTLVQLARAYAAIGNDGVQVPVSLLKVEDAPAGQRVLSEDVARSLRVIMHEVVEPGGTGTRASLAGYRVAGKTGTVHKSQAGGYAEDRYIAVFAGLAPLADPRFALVVMINEPAGENYSGGRVAAPVFSRVMEGTLRLMNVPPHRSPELQVAMQGGEGHS